MTPSPPYRVLDRRLYPNTQEMVPFISPAYFERQPWSTPFPARPTRVVLEDGLDYYAEGDAFSLPLVRVEFQRHPPEWRVLALAALPSVFLKPPPRYGPPLREQDVAFGWDDPYDLRTWLAFDGLTVQVANDARHLVHVLAGYPWPRFLEEEYGRASPFRAQRGVLEVHHPDAYAALLLPGEGDPRSVTHTPGRTTLLTRYARIDLHRSPVPEPAGDLELHGALAALTYTQGHQRWVLASMSARPDPEPLPPPS